MKTPAQLLQPLCRFARRLHRNQRGAVAPLFLVSSTLVFGTSIGSVDLMRYTSVKAHLQAALDNAALAAGKLASLEGMDADLLAEAQGYFRANFPNNYLGSTINAAGLSLETDGSTLTLDITGGLPLLTTGFLDISAFGLQTSATVSLDGKGPSEVVFALDRGNPNSSSGSGSGYPGNSGSSGNSNGWKGCKNGGGHPNCNNTEFDSDPVSWAATTLAELLLPEDPRGSGVHVGLVPFSEVVNVGAAGKPWVAEWLQEWNGDQRVQYVNANYTENVWRGCIAEPRPWDPPAMANALSPDARFQPVLGRVPLELYNPPGNSPGNSGNYNNGIQLNGKDNKQDLYDDGYSPGQIAPMSAPVSPAYDRRLWAEFSEYVGPGNSSQHRGGFYVFGAFENERCNSANRTRFLSNDRQVVTAALNAIQSQNADGPALTPAGLLWSWRMIHPTWRSHPDGWAVPESLLEPQENKQKAIVLFAANPETTWDDIDKSAAASATDFDGEFAFELEYKVATCPNQGKKADCKYDGMATHTQSPIGPSEMKVKDKDAPETQYPATSVRLADPFSKDTTPSLAGWPSVNNYTREICDAIKADGIEIYVVDVNDTGSSVLSHCSSDGILYSLDRIPELRNVIQVTQTSGERLRLIR